ncbi:MAG TPA: MFS transporter [Chloroflexota bacterium]|nr:MFS transporter [Chloroflexota bacterium]
MEASLWKSRMPTTVLFFVNGFVIASWAARIPSIKASLGLGQAELGIALLLASIGALVGLNIGGAIASRYRPRSVATVAGVAFCLALPPLAFAPDLAALAGGLFVLGLCSGFMDVSMNADAAALEKLYRRAVMSASHAFFSWGGLAGAAAGAIAAGLAATPGSEFLAVAALGVVAVVAAGLTPNPEVPTEPPAPAFSWPSKAVLAIGLVAFCAAITEGSIIDWSAIYLHGTLKTSLAVAALGLGAYSVMMATVRLTGDRLSSSLGAPRVVRAGFAVCMVGLVLALTVPAGAAGILGFALVGVGAATIFPLAMSAAGSAGGTSAAASIAAAATCGYTAFLVGPVLIGVVAQALSLRVALTFVLALLVAGFLMAGAVRGGGGVARAPEIEVL